MIMQSLLPILQPPHYLKACAATPKTKGRELGCSGLHVHTYLDNERQVRAFQHSYNTRQLVLRGR